jgi:hypothetical protein
MGNPQKTKGDQFERDIHRTLETAGLWCWRPRAGYPHDIGDILTNRFTLQAKAFRDVARGIREGNQGLVRQLPVARTEHDVTWGAVVVKRHQAPVDQAHVVMTLATFTQLLAELEDTDR